MAKGGPVRFYPLESFLDIVSSTSVGRQWAIADFLQQRGE